MKKIMYLAILLLCSVSVLAADPPIYSDPNSGAIRGADPVAYFSLTPGDKAVMGSDEFSYEWNGAIWKFANKANMEKFRESPESFAPQYGGYCAFALSHNFTTDIRPNSWIIIDGKLYLNHNKASQKNFLKKTTKKIAKADKNWPAVLSKCSWWEKCD